MSAQTWQDAIKVATPVAHEEWRRQGLPGTHMVWAAGIYQGPTMWILIHGPRAWLVDQDEDSLVMDAPAIVVDRATGLPRVTQYLDILEELETADEVGDIPAHLAD